ncbi:hypothetical protein C8R43DRAFT_1117143 [Mycena crocata]|nr:hypothetical protein C8R43DRAFT_1117143 [Mycena crocata]
MAHLPMRFADPAIWEAQTRFLTISEFGPEARLVLTLMSAGDLFQLASSSRKLYRTVSAFLFHLKDHRGEEDEYWMDDSNSSGEGDSDNAYSVCSDLTSSSDRFEASRPGLVNFPTDVGDLLLRELGLVDQMRLSKACASTQDLVARELQRLVAVALAPFRLPYWEIRLLQTVTGTVVLGSTITSLLRRSTPFAPGDLDFYTAFSVGWDVIRFLRRSGKYKVARMSADYKISAGIGRVWTLKEVGGEHKINVIESLTHNPYDAIMHFHSTCVFGAWDAAKIWVGYPELTEAGISITAPSLLNGKGDLKYYRRLWRILRKYVRRGFTFSLHEYEADHTCGVDWNCPATLRTTDDGGCLVLRLPVWNYTDEYVADAPTSWSLGGSGCAMGLLSNGTRPARSLRIDLWKDHIRQFLDMPSIPKSDVDYNGLV